jgi:hypothetical protein
MVSSSGSKVNPSSACYLIHVGSLLGLFFGPEYGDDVAPKRRLTSNGLLGIMSQNIELWYYFVHLFTDHGNFISEACKLQQCLLQKARSRFHIHKAKWTLSCFVKLEMGVLSCIVLLCWSYFSYFSWSSL